MAKCREVEPTLGDVGKTRVACWLHESTAADVAQKGEANVR
jgi:hypothetical protein